MTNTIFTDFKFSDEFTASIEAKVKAEQDALRAENEKRRRITEAEAAKAERELAADGEAYQIRVASEERAAAIKREWEALEGSPLLIQLRIAERWNGVLPQLTGVGGTPLLNIDEILKQQN